jgi:hypothetical protein
MRTDLQTGHLDMTVTSLVGLCRKGPQAESDLKEGLERPVSSYR